MNVTNCSHYEHELVVAMLCCKDASLTFTKILKLELSNNRSSLRKSSVRHAGAGLDAGDRAAREMEPKSRNLNQIRRNNNIVSLG